MSNLLCIDFDWFFPNPMEAGDIEDPTAGLYDWGHRESPLFLSNTIWSTRAVGFFGNELPLPTVQPPEGGWEAFWSRFTFTDDAWFGYADSNAYAGTLTPPSGAQAFERVVLFDAHHDSGYRINTYEDYVAQPAFSCEDWMLEHQRRGTPDLSVRYPQWKPDGVSESLPGGVLTRLSVDDGAPVDGVAFDAVFVCRSGAWVPSWCDADFVAFIDAAPLDGEQMDDAPLERGFDEEASRRTAEQMRALYAQM